MTFSAWFLTVFLVSHVLQPLCSTQYASVTFAIFDLGSVDILLHKINSFEMNDCFWPHSCGILVPGPGTKPWLRAVKTLSLNHWTDREFSK